MISSLNASYRNRGPWRFVFMAKWFPLVLITGLLGISLELMSCSGGGSTASAPPTPPASPPPPGAISVSVAPSPASVQAGTAQNFNSTVTNSSNQNVTWSLSGSGCSGATCGTLSNVAATSVTYTAPTAVPSPAAVSLTATSVADTTKSGSAAITVTATPPPASISVSVAPSPASVQAGTARNFNSTVSNSTNQNVTWSLSGSGCSGATCGTLSNVAATSVTYTAPTAVPNPAAVSLTATSAADTTKSGSAAITVTATPPPSGAPTLVQHVSHSSTQTHFVSTYAIRFTFPTGSGNCIFVAVQSSGGSVPTVTDDTGNSYTQVINASDSTHTEITLYKAPVSHPGSQHLQVAFSTAAEFVAAEASEFMNVDPGCATDGAASANSGSGGQLTTGTLTTTVNGDLLYAFGIQDSNTNPITSWTAGTGFALLGADVMDSHFTEWAVQPTAGAVNPSAVIAPSSNNWFMAAMAIKAGTSGTAPSGIHGVHNLHLALPNGQNYPLTVQFPCTTTTGPIVVIGNAEPNNDFTGLADSNGNHWTKRGAAVEEVSGLADIWDTDAAPTTCSSTMTVTIHKTGTDTIGSTLIFIDVSDCGPQPCFDSGPGYATGVGVQTQAQGTVVGASITPTTATGACFASMAVDANSITGVSPGLFLSSTANPEPPDFQDDENNGYAVIYNPGTSGFTFTWNETSEVNGWANGITCYKGPGSN
jgi:hypothetical protein